MRISEVDCSKPKQVNRRNIGAPKSVALLGEVTVPSPLDFDASCKRGQVISEEALEAGKQQSVTVAARAALGRAATLASLFRMSVVGVDARFEKYSRCAYQIARREVYLRVRPAPGLRPRDLQPLPNPAAVDPWSVEPADLEDDTVVPATCPTCDGDRKVSCSTCGGTKRVRCGECGGGGRVRGERGLRNCGACRGRGDRKCGNCSAGRVTCQPCEGYGRVFACLAIRSSKQVRVVHDASVAREVHTRIAELDDFDVHATVPADITFDSGWGARDVSVSLQTQVDSKLDRITSSRIQSLAMPIYDVHYETLIGSGTVRVIGKGFAIGKSSQWLPWQKVMGLASLAAVLSFVGLTIVRSNYMHSHAWHSTLGAADQLLLPILLAPVCIAFAAVFLLSGRRCWSLFRLGVPSVAGALCLISVPVVANTARPTAAQAREYLNGGDIANATLTAEATLNENHDDFAAGAVLDDIQFRRLQAAPDISEASRVLGQRWQTEAALASANTAFRIRAEQELERLLVSKDAQALRTLSSAVSEWAPHVARRAGEHGHAFQSDIAIAEERYSEALSHLDQATKLGLSEDAAARRREQVAAQLDGKAALHFDAGRAEPEPFRRQSEFKEVYRLLERRSSLTATASQVNVAELTRLDAQTDETVKAIEARQRRADELAAKKQAAIERRETAIREAQERRRAWAFSPLLCNDGTNSPSCTCGNPRRGCCSHHGGVAGCSASR